MRLQIYFQCCLVVALVTLMRFFFSVSACMVFQVTALFEFLVTTCAGKVALSVLNMFNLLVHL